MEKLANMLFLSLTIIGCLIVSPIKGSQKKDVSQKLLSHLKYLFGTDGLTSQQLNKINQFELNFINVPEKEDAFFDHSENSYVALTNDILSCWDLPTPPGWNNTWEKFACIYLSRKMNWGGDRQVVEGSIEHFLNKRDMKTNKLSILLKLLSTYDEALFNNTVYFSEIFFGNDKHKTDNLIWAFSAAAEKDLYSFFKKNGIGAKRVSLPIEGTNFYELLEEYELGSIREKMPKILVDQTHSYNFETYHLAYFLKQYSMFGVHSDRSLRMDLYKNIDVIVTHQDFVGVPYTEDETKELLKFVKDGGGVLLLGNKYIFKKYQHLSDLDDIDEIPINKLAQEFGFIFTENNAIGKLKFTGNHFYDRADIVVNIPGLTTIQADEKSKHILVDENEEPVMVIREYGKGRIALIGGTSFIPFLDQLNLKGLFVELFYWLGENSPNFRSQKDKFYELFPGIKQHYGWDYELENKPHLKRRYNKRSAFIWPENEYNVHGVKILYANSMQKNVEFIIHNIYPVVYNALQIYYQCPPLSKSVNRIHFYPHWGSGYTWMLPAVAEPIIGIPCLGKDHDQIKGIFAHEMTHAWGIPGPPGWEHCWTTFTDHYFDEYLDLYNPEIRMKNYQKRIDKLLKFDPKLAQIDISMERIDDVEAEHIRWTKFALLFEKLVERYGNNLMANYIKIFRKYGTEEKESLSMSEFIYYLSLAAGDDLYPFFEKYGTQLREERKEINFHNFNVK